MSRRIGKGTELSERQHRTRRHVKVLGTFREAPKVAGMEFRGWVCGLRRGWGFQMPGLGFP